MKKVIIAVAALGILPLSKLAIDNHIKVSTIKECASLLRNRADSDWYFEKQVGAIDYEGDVTLVTLMEGTNNTGMVIYHCEDGNGRVIHSGYGDWYGQYAEQLEGMNETVRFITLK